MSDNEPLIRPVGPIGEGIADLARQLTIPEDEARTLGEQAEQLVEDQLAVLHEVAARLARIAWRDDNHQLPEVHRKSWEDTAPNDRAAYLAHALATAAELVVCGLLAPRLPDTNTPAEPRPSSGDWTARRDTNDPDGDDYREVGD